MHQFVPDQLIREPCNKLLEHLLWPKWESSTLLSERWQVLSWFCDVTQSHRIVQSSFPKESFPPCKSPFGCCNKIAELLKLQGGEIHLAHFSEVSVYGCLGSVTPQEYIMAEENCPPLWWSGCGERRTGRSDFWYFLQGHVPWNLISFHWAPRSSSTSQEGQRLAAKPSPVGLHETCKQSS